MLHSLSRKPSSDTLVGALLECHARIRHFSAVARALADATGRSDADLVGAAEDVRRYFEQALPLHARDEDDSIAPRLLGREPTVDAALATMRSQHDEHRPSLTELVSVCDTIARAPGEHEALRARLSRVVEHLVPQFEVHMELEERVIFPAVLRWLDADVQDLVRRELRARRQEGGR